MKKFFFSLLIIFSVGLLAPFAAKAAVLTVAAPAITLDTQGQSVNAVEIHLSFDPKQFIIKSISDGGSIVDNWITPPAFSNTSGTVDLAGIIPGGITTASGTIVSLVVEQRSAGAMERFTVVGAQALLNDGQGTPAQLSMATPLFSAAIAPAASASSSDTTAPDPFTPEVSSDPSVFDGKYFLVFGTTDQGSGIDHYEVLEVPQGSNVSDSAQWQAARSPYLLHDQSLGSDIYVRAVDRAGNFRIAEIPAASGGRSAPQAVSGGIPWAISGILVISIALFLWIKKRRSA